MNEPLAQIRSNAPKVHYPKSPAVAVLKPEIIVMDESSSKSSGSDSDDMSTVPTHERSHRRDKQYFGRGNPKNHYRVTQSPRRRLSERDYKPNRSESFSTARTAVSSMGNEPQYMRPPTPGHGNTEGGWEWWRNKMFDPRFDTFEAWIMIQNVSNPGELGRDTKTNAPKPVKHEEVQPLEEVLLLPQHLPREAMLMTITDLDLQAPVGEKLVYFSASVLKRINSLLSDKNMSETDNHYEWCLAQADSDGRALSRAKSRSRSGSTTMLYLWRRPKADVDLIELCRQFALAAMRQTETGYQTRQEQSSQRQALRHVADKRAQMESPSKEVKDHALSESRKAINAAQKQSHPASYAMPPESTSEPLKQSPELHKQYRFALNVTKKGPATYQPPVATSEADDYDAWLTAPEDLEEPATSERPPSVLLPGGHGLASGTDAQTSHVATHLRPRHGNNTAAQSAAARAALSASGPPMVQAQRMGPPDTQTEMQQMMQQQRQQQQMPPANRSSPWIRTAAEIVYERQKGVTQAKVSELNYFDDGYAEYGHEPVGARGRERSRSRTKDFDAITGAAAATAAAVGVKKYRGRQSDSSDTDFDSRRRTRIRRKSSSPSAQRLYYGRCRRRDISSGSSVTSSDPYSPSPVRASGGGVYRASPSLPPPPDYHFDLTPAPPSDSPSTIAQLPSGTPGAFPLPTLTPTTSDGRLRHSTRRTRHNRDETSLRFSARQDSIIGSRDKADDEPPGNTPTIVRRRKTLGYGFSISLILFVLIGLFAACVQSIAVYRRMHLPKDTTPTWDDIDLFELLSNNCWLALGLLFSLLLTLKHGSENGGYKQWIWIWCFTALSLGSCIFSISFYITSPALSQGLSGGGSVIQVLVYFLTIRLLEKTDVVQIEMRRTELDEWMHNYEKRCKQRRSELYDEISHLEERRRQILAAKVDDDVRGRVRQTFRDEALGSSLTGSRSQEEEDLADKAVRVGV